MGLDMEGRNSIQNDRREEMDVRPRSYVKLAAKYVIFLSAMYGAYVGAVYFARHADSNRHTAELLRIEDQIKTVEEHKRETEMGDGAGGETPAETLSLYIKAVEVKEYRRAAEYFVMASQEKEEKRLVALSADKKEVRKFLDLMKSVKSSEPREGSTEFWLEVRSAVSAKQTPKPEPDMVIRFRKLPNGIWKIASI